MSDYSQKIVEMYLLKQQEVECDKEAASTWHVPSLPANAGTLLRLSSLNFAFAEDYLGFLRTADGWKGFFVSTDLHGAEFLLSSSGEERLIQRPEVASYLKTQGVLTSEVKIIGSSEFDADLFILVSESSSVLSGSVFWYALQEVEVFESFESFFVSMIAIQSHLTKKACKDRYQA